MKDYSEHSVEELIRLSRFIDADLPDVDTEKQITRLARDPALYRRWRNYHLTGDVLRRRDRSSGVDSDSFVQTVMARINEEATGADLPEQAESPIGSKVVHIGSRHPASSATDRESGQSLGQSAVQSTAQANGRGSWRYIAAAASLVVMTAGIWLAGAGVVDQPVTEQVVSAPAETAAAPGLAVAAQDVRQREVAKPRPAGVRNAQLNAYLLSHSNHGSAQIGGAWGLVRVAALSQQNGR